MGFLVVKDLDYSDIFKNLTVEFQKNSINYISGSNMCGKTTLIKILSGLIETTDIVFYNNKDISKISSFNYVSFFSTIFNTDLNNFTFSTVQQEFLYILDKINIDSKEKKARLKELVNLFELNNLLQTDINTLTLENKISTIIVEKLLKNPKILLIDDIFVHLSKKSSIKIVEKLKSIPDLTIIMTSSSLDLCLCSDYLYIINDKKIILNGKVMDVLKEDSTLNKIGLNLPFMVDLSLKLKYYDLLDDIEFNKSEMINNLWK